MSGSAARAPSGLRQLRFLIKLWWLQMRRRAVRVGEAPKLSGAPTFLLLTLFGAAYLAMVTWQSVARNVQQHVGNFTWHMLGVLLLGFGTGMSKRFGRLQLRGTRSDTFLDALPLRTLALVGLPFADTATFVPLTMAGVLAAISVHGSFGLSAIIAALLGFFAFTNCYLAGSATIAWIRALGPASAALWGGYVGLALSVIGMISSFTPLERLFVGHVPELATRLAQAWIGPSPALAALYAAFLTVGCASYAALAAAHRYGIDQIDPQIRAPAQTKRFRDRFALERVMMLRQGGSALLVIHSILVGAGLWAVLSGKLRKVPAELLLFATGFALYFGVLQTIGQAGRAARSDQSARPFLSALPLSPHQVLDGKTRALRVLLSPVLLLLVLLAVASALHADSPYTFRIVLTLVALFALTDGAVSIAFLSTGVGVLGVGGAQSTTGFSTQILMLPLFATLLAPSNWSATTACIAALAVCFESHRAARLNVRWIDDPADDVERETTVWRALLAASAFFALQAVSYRILSIAQLPAGYALATAFAASAVLLALLTWRNAARIERPRFVPRAAIYWPLGALAGVASGLLALGLVKLFPPTSEVAAPQFSGGEVIAVGFTMIVLAPLVEEYFFRGWLQRAIEADLPQGMKHWAFALGAFAFALAHLGSYGVPQLVLGLLAGALFARGGGLLPAMLAHALHNGVVLWLGG
jgi:membrane protease YdiL (CAAX protease family)